MLMYFPKIYPIQCHPPIYTVNIIVCGGYIIVGLVIVIVVRIYVIVGRSIVIVSLIIFVVCRRYIIIGRCMVIVGWMYIIVSIFVPMRYMIVSWRIAMVGRQSIIVGTFCVVVLGTKMEKMYLKELIITSHIQTSRINWQTLDFRIFNKNSNIL